MAGELSLRDNALAGLRRTAETLHVDGLPSELEGEEQLNVTFGRFGCILACSLRVRGDGGEGQRSWALVTFANVEGARAASAAAAELGVTIESLDLQRALESTGAMRDIAQSHQDKLTQVLRVASRFTVHVDGLSGKLEEEEALAQAFGAFGTILATTLRRRREGKKRSWALISFSKDSEAEAAVGGVGTLDAEPALLAQQLDLDKALESTGGMAEVARLHQDRLFTAMMSGSPKAQTSAPPSEGKGEGEGQEEVPNGRVPQNGRGRGSGRGSKAASKPAKLRKLRKREEALTVDVENPLHAEMQGNESSADSTPDVSPSRGGSGKDEAAEPHMVSSQNVDDWGRLSVVSDFTHGDLDAAIGHWCKNACASNWLERGILCTIVMNTVLLAVGSPSNTFDESVLTGLMIADTICAVVFTAEMFIRIIALGFWDRKGTDPVPRYMNDDWNKLDFFVVLSSWVNIVVEVTGIELGVSLSSLRALRIMRMLKAFKSIEGIRVILATVAAAMPHTINVVGFLCFLFLVSGLMGVQMFRGLTRFRCQYSGFDLMSQLSPDRFPLVDGPLGPWQLAQPNHTGLRNPPVVVGAATSEFNASAPGPFPAPYGELSYEQHALGTGVWAHYCTTDEDCPLYNSEDPWNRVQTCQPSLNPGRTFSSYDAAPNAWLNLFINMACLYWWELAHRYVDANSLHDDLCIGTADDAAAFPSCEDAFAAGGGDIKSCPAGCTYRPGGPGTHVAWAFGAFNVFMFTLVTVNMFVAAITTIFMDQRHSANPEGGAAAAPKTDAQKKQEAKAARWSRPPYYSAACGGEGPFVEPLRAELEELQEFLAEAHEEEAKYPGDRTEDIPRIEAKIDEKLEEILNAGGSDRTGDGSLPPEQRTGIIHQPIFDRVVLFFILVNTIVLASEHHDRDQCLPMQKAAFASYGCDDCQTTLQVQSLCQHPSFISNVKYANYFFNFVFLVECLLKVLGMGFRSYISVTFNKLDFFIVVTSLVDMVGEALAEPGTASSGSIFKLFRTFRLFRVLRVARILYRNENLRHVLKTVFGSGASLINLTMFILFSILLFSVLGMHLLGGHYGPAGADLGSSGLLIAANNDTLLGRLTGDGVYEIRKEGAELRVGYDVPDFIAKGLIPRRNFEDFPRAFMLSFQIMTGDDWVNQMQDYLEVRPGWVTWLLFFANFGFCNWILLSLFIAVILENFEVAEAEKMAKQQSIRTTNIRKTEEEAKKPKISFPHRLTWLFGGTRAGKKAGTLWSMGPDVVVDPDNGNLLPGTEWYNDDCALFVLQADHPWRLAARRLAESPTFDAAVLAAICLSTVVLAVEGPPGSLPAETLYLFERVNQVFFLVFIVEFVAKVLAFGFMFTPNSYLKLGWNRLDFVVIVGSIIQQLGGNAGFVRLLRCLRPLRIINRNEGMRVIISAVVDSLGVNIGVLALSVVGLLMFAILGISLFGGTMWSCNCAYVYPDGVTPETAVFGDDGGWLDRATNMYNESRPMQVVTEQDCINADLSGGRYGVDPSLPTSISECFWDNRPYNFDNVGNAMMSLFTASTLAGWTDIMEAAVDQNGIGNNPAPFSRPSVLAYFLLYVLIMAFFVTQLFIGVLIDFIGTKDGSALLTEEQQKLTDQMKYARFHRPELEASAPKQFLRGWCWHVAESHCWELLSNGMIVFNVAVMMCEHEDQSNDWWLMVEGLNLTCLVFFIVEMFLKLIAYFPRQYFSEPWNRFDFVVVTISWFTSKDIGLIDFGGAQAVRAMRALRIVIVLKNAKGIRSMFRTLLLSIGPGFNITILVGLLYSVYAIIGMMIFGNTPLQDVECMAESNLQDVGRYIGKASVAEYCRIGMGQETCTPSVNPLFPLLSDDEFVDASVNCTDGYIPGDSAAKSTTCKAGCTLVEATYVDRSAWFSQFARGTPGQMLPGSNRQYTHHANFASFGSAMKLLFQVATGQDWKFVMYAVGGEPGQPEAKATSAFLFFASFFFFSNYILLNLFVAVILDNFSSSMRESELDVSEENFIEFKRKFRHRTSDEQPEMLLFRDLWKLLEDVGGTDKPDHDGVVHSNALCPPKEQWWNNDCEMAWALSCDAGLVPGDLRSFLRRLYTTANSPLKQKGQPGISFGEWYDVLMSTPAEFESADQGDLGLLSEWERYRRLEESVPSPKVRPPPSYLVIKAAVKALRFNQQYKKMVRPNFLSVQSLTPTAEPVGWSCSGR